MEVIPAVDIMKGQVVRLLRGDPKFAKSYEHLGGPVVLAKKWEVQGARIIHVIDLDAALNRGNNTHIIENITRSVKVPVQVGGGIRSLSAARAMFKIGVAKVVLGTAVFEKPSIVKTSVREFGKEKVIVALDSLNGTVMIHGWKRSVEISVEKAVSEFSRMGANLFLVTSVARDGTMSGPEFETLERLSHLGVNLIAAGGIRNLDDIINLKRLGIYGAVIGKALYEGSLNLSEALARVWD